MDIDPHIATTIVENIKGVLQHDINFFNTEGRVIASTDPTRIGTDHEAALLAARTGRIVAVDAEHPFAGARDGINVPVMQGDTVIAVVGITGERARVEPFGNVIKKMTEILVRENLEQVSRFDRRMMMTNLTNLLIAPQSDAAPIGYLATTLGVDLERPRIVAVGRLEHGTGGDAGATQDGTYDALDALLGGDAEQLYTIYGGEYRLLLDAARLTADETRDLLVRLGDAAARINGRRLAFGMGDTAHTVAEYHRCYRQARTAALWSVFAGDRARTGMADASAAGAMDTAGVGVDGGVNTGTTATQVMAYDDMGIGLALCSVPDDTAARFVRNVFDGLTEEEIDEADAVFDAYTRHNGSISRTAEELFLHKNTVQNRLNRITRLTGYNPRELADHTTLATAFTLRRLIGMADSRIR
ncbi:sugar diacid recognition domain-containing protein [Bifidobacterium sp. SO4]|uniref:CdaR family transcriptional regulator n=1 Tax=Bifidobacterium sp. SO4 TaxID=2809030 RepID=UPI001BDBB8BD|nr:sugar diacid recognition domain-containing protein [Bifidobacterium sp. SO4]MBT1170509.1 helix-turn-helix domain-containing protein [Bifidobacterium sp. SO4]